MPEDPGAAGHPYINCSPECWRVYGEVLEREYTNALLFARVHQLTVDSYALQHPGGRHPDKSIAVHLLGMFLTQERGLRSNDVPPLLRLAVQRTDRWPRLAPPEQGSSLTVFDVALADESEHEDAVRRWAASVWTSWIKHRDTAAELARVVARPATLK